jgi:uncharacterized RDD family membrane protein YckC
MDPSPPSWQGGQPTPPPSGYPPPGGQGGYGYPPAGDQQGYPPAGPAWPEQQQPYGGPYGGQPNPGQYSGGPVLAGFWIRVGATLLDALILAIPLFVVGFLFGLISAAVNGDEVGRTAAAVVVDIIGGLVVTALYAAYTIILISRGQTIGMRVCGTRCVSEATGQPPDLKQSALRWLVPEGISYLLQGTMAGFVSLILTPVVLLDVLWMLWDPKNQTLHDKVAKTLVIKG